MRDTYYPKESFVCSNEIDEHLATLLPEENTSPLIPPARYALLSSGKRMRPLITLSITSAYNISLNQALDPACALEFVHAYSLIHDDLPCMDDDDFRRGKPSTHKVYGEALALLAGNYLLTEAFSLISSSPSLISALSRGSNAMLAGQAIDISQTATEWPTIKNMYDKKTGALIHTAFTFAIILSSPSVQDTKHLQTIAQSLGLAYQIADDIKDKETDTGPTSITSLGLPKTQNMLSSLIKESEHHLSQLSVTIPYLEQLLSNL